MSDAPTDNVIGNHVSRVFSDTGGEPSGEGLEPGDAEAGAKPVSEGQAQEGEEVAPETDVAAGAGDTSSPDQTKERPPTTVPIQAHDAERSAHKTTKEELERTRGTMSRVEDTLQRIMTLPQMQTPGAVPAADARAQAMAEDPQAYVLNLESRLDAQERDRQSDVQRTAASQQIVSAYAGAAQQFMAGGHPDYPQARDHLLSSRRGELQMLGYEPQQVEQVLDAEEAAIVQLALSQNANPAERLYAVAESRGYKTTAAASGNGGAMATLKKGEAAANTLGSGSGDAQAGPMSLEALANIDDQAEFLVAFEKMRKAGRLG